MNYKIHVEQQKLDQNVLNFISGLKINLSLHAAIREFKAFRIISLSY